MTHYDKTNRISTTQVEQKLTNMNFEIIKKSEILSKLRTQGHSNLLHELSNAKFTDFQVNTMLKEA